MKKMCWAKKKICLLPWNEVTKKVTTGRPQKVFMRKKLFSQIFEVAHEKDMSDQEKNTFASME